MGTTAEKGRVGVMLRRDVAATDFIPFARLAEKLGFDDVWVVEDLGFWGGVAQAAAIASATERIRVGLGILPVAARNVAYAAMELSTLAELFPGRVTVGIGHGLPEWIQQVNAWPRSPLTLFDEYTAALGKLLRGEAVTTEGCYVSLDNVALEHPPTVLPPLLGGVRGPKSMEVVAKNLSGAILAEPAATQYVGATRGMLGGQAHLVAFEFANVDDDLEAAYEEVRTLLAGVGDPALAAHINPLPFAEELRELRASHSSTASFADAMPAEWLDALSLIGSASKVRAHIDDLIDAGADTVVMIPTTAERPLDSLHALSSALQR
jgi:5,10-methylenetetrahydromethanopterin reductase